jgi:two-component system, LytTR family, response regulator
MNPVSHHPNPNPRLRTLIVDDEPLARDKVRILLAKDPEIEIIGECANGQEAVEMIERESPDLVFLDVQMPGLDGFGVLKQIGAEHAPGVVFVTAYDQHALHAFEVHALDYLVKPFAQKRFNETLQRAKEQLRNRQGGVLTQQLLSLLGGLGSSSRFLERIVVRSNGRVFFLKVNDIDWIEAAGNYLNIHIGNEAHLLRETMNSIEAQLDARKFVRIHRSTLVNIERIKELSPLFHGDYVVTLMNGSRLTLSRSYRERLTGLMNGTL